MAKEEFFEEESSPKKKEKEMSGKTGKSTKGQKASTKSGGAGKTSKAKEKSAAAAIVASSEEGTEEKLALDITWVAILVFVAFFAGFWVRGIMNPSTTASTVPTTNVPQMSSGAQGQGVCPVTGKTGQAGEIPTSAIQGITGTMMGIPTETQP